MVQRRKSTIEWTYKKYRKFVKTVGKKLKRIVSVDLYEVFTWTNAFLSFSNDLSQQNPDFLNDVTFVYNAFFALDSSNQITSKSERYFGRLLEKIPPNVAFNNFMQDLKRKTLIAGRTKEKLDLNNQIKLMLCISAYPILENLVW